MSGNLIARNSQEKISLKLEQICVQHVDTQAKALNFIKSLYNFSIASSEMNNIFFPKLKILKKNVFISNIFNKRIDLTKINQHGYFNANSRVTA